MAAERFDKEKTNPKPFIPFQIKRFCLTKKGTNLKTSFDILKKRYHRAIFKIWMG